jgi:[NiFe] hydrogenase large subunit
MSRIVIDPITRIEGHLKIELEVTGNTVADAWSSGTLFRGVEAILQGRNPEDAWLFTQRVCGVCTYVHGSASVRCVEDALSASIPKNARVVRNLLMGSQFVHDHPIHFYHLHGLDWVDIVSALSADPGKTADAAKAVSPEAPPMDFSAIQDRLKKFVASGQLGIFAGGYWGHPAYVLSPEENLLIAAHYLLTLRQQLKAAEMQAIFGAKNPHVQSLRVGGVTCKWDITAERIARFRTLLTDMRSYIDTIYIPDVKYLARKYGSWKGIGGFNNYLAYGDFSSNDEEGDNSLFPGGVILDKTLSSIGDVDLSKISEHVNRSWYSGSSLNPAIGQTVPNYTGYDTQSQYSWLKAPRYDGSAMEVGPLARVLIAYGKNTRPVVSLVNSFLADANLTTADLHSTLGRMAARALETKIIADAMDRWLKSLDPSGEVLTTVTIPATGSINGTGLNEAPRGALGHWIKIQDGKIGNYQMVVPSTWNLGPRDGSGVRGPVEQALIGLPVADPSKPVEILRLIHSYDPCLACAVHVIDTKKDKTYTVKVT